MCVCVCVCVRAFVRACLCASAPAFVCVRVRACVLRACAHGRGKKYSTVCMRDLNAVQCWRSRHLINTRAERDLNNVVMIESVKGHGLLAFKNFPPHLQLPRLLCFSLAFAICNKSSRTVLHSSMLVYW